MDELRQAKTIIPDLDNIGKLTPEKKESLYEILTLLKVNDRVESESKKLFVVIKSVYENDWLKLTLKPTTVLNSNEQALWLLTCTSKNNQKEIDAITLETQKEIAATTLETNELFTEYWGYLLDPRRKKTD